MPDLGPQRFEPPLLAPTVPVNLGQPGAHAPVLSPFEPSWQNLLPRGPTSGDMISAAELGAKLRQTEQQNAGYNAMARLYADPGNVDANGMLKPDALRQLAGEGFPKQMMEALGAKAEMAKTQADIARANMQTAQAGQKFLTEEQTRLLGDFEPLVAEYDRNVKEYGPERAKQIGQEHYTELVGQARSSGNYSPQILQRISPSFDPERLRANIVGLKGIQDREKQQQDADVLTDYGKNPPVQYLRYRSDNHTTDITGKSPYTPTGIAESKGAEAQLYRVKTADGREQLGRRAATGGFVNDETGERIEKVTGATKVGTKEEENPEQAAQPSGPTDKHGQEYLDALPSSRASLIKGYAEGRVAFPGSFSLRSPYWQKMVADITQYDPTFDAVNYNARSATRRDFTSGKSAQNVTSFNTAIGHLGSLYGSIDKLNNSDYPWWNTVSNFANVQGGNTRFQAAKKEFEVERQAVADELTRAFRQTGGNVSDIKGWEENINTADSPTALKASVKTAVDLLRSRIESVNQQYRRGMGTSADVMDLLTPKARETLAKLPGGDDLLKDSGTVTPGVGNKAAERPGEAKPQSAAPVAAGKMSPGADGIYTLKPGDDWKSLPPNSRFRLPDDPPDKMRIRP